MCTTLLLLSTLAMLWRRRFGNRVHPPAFGICGDDEKQTFGLKLESNEWNPGTNSQNLAVVLEFSDRDATYIPHGALLPPNTHKEEQLSIVYAVI
ncbi:Progressive rod-cone degeneration protein [Pteropus alecto]|uniref:Progressive rod-cone degeneration protein n=1 Tax=Pteropus alecto TaxID=9402 RepID=L5KLZ8_PTEAL|nr:Progressive rod-cone degeneration protein [Pteropus alecto]